VFNEVFTPLSGPKVLQYSVKFMHHMEARKERVEFFPPFMAHSTHTHTDEKLRQKLLLHPLRLWVSFSTFYSIVPEKARSFFAIDPNYK
jgi:hypothetical protein